MTDNITLPRAVVEEVRAAIRGFYNKYSDEAVHEDAGCAIDALDAALAEPEPAFQVDAERYRWLRGEVQGPHTPLAQVVWKRNNIRESGDWTNLSDGHALDKAIDDALAEPPAKPEPATDATDNRRVWDAYIETCRDFERFHGITKGDKT
jgi:hypothetical protein